MKKIIIYMLFLISAVSLLSMADAAVSQKINFQGQLTNAAGKPVTGTVAMTFTIYNALTSGNTLKTITNSAVTFSETGLYNVELDLTGLNLNQDLWLGITVGSDNEMTPRAPILPSASSIFSLSAQNAQSALNSDQLGGVNANLYLLKSGGTLTGSLNLGGFSIVTSSSIEGISRIKWADGSISTHAASGSGADMTKATYDTNSNNIVDNSEKLGGNLPAFYLTNSVATTTYLKLSGGTLSGHLIMGNYSVLSSSSIEGITKIKWADGSISTHAATMSGADMTKATYDTNSNNIVDNSEKLGGALPAAYLTTAVATTTYMKLSGGAFSGPITTSQNRLQISTNVYTVGYSSATAFFGDGSNLNLKRSYGEMFTTANAAGTTISVQSTFQKAIAPTSDGILNNFTNSSANKLTYTGTKSAIFKCQVSCTAQNTGIGQTTSYAIAKNGAILAKSQEQIVFTVALDKAEVSVTCIVQLNQNDFVELWVTNNSSTAAITISYMNFNVMEME
jgi:hypothetical protein